MTSRSWSWSRTKMDRLCNTGYKSPWIILFVSAGSSFYTSNSNLSSKAENKSTVTPPIQKTNKKVFKRQSLKYRTTNPPELKIK
jgi:hypothetical protein